MSEIIACAEFNKHERTACTTYRLEMFDNNDVKITLHCLSKKYSIKSEAGREIGKKDDLKSLPQSVMNDIFFEKEKHFGKVRLGNKDYEISCNLAEKPKFYIHEDLLYFPYTKTIYQVDLTEEKESEMKDHAIIGEKETPILKEFSEPKDTIEKVTHVSEQEKALKKFRRPCKFVGKTSR